MLVRLVCDLQLVHEDGALGMSFQKALLTDVIDSPRDVLLDRRQHLCGGQFGIDHGIAIEEFRVDVL